MITTSRPQALLDHLRPARYDLVSLVLVMPQLVDGVTVPVVQAQHLPWASGDDKTPQVVSHSASGKFGAKLARRKLTDPCHRRWNTCTWTLKERWRQRNTHSATEAFTLSDVRFEPKSPNTHTHSASPHADRTVSSTSHPPECQALGCPIQTSMPSKSSGVWWSSVIFLSAFVVFSPL